MRERSREWILAKLAAAEDEVRKFSKQRDAYDHRERARLRALQERKQRLLLECTEARWLADPAAKAAEMQWLRDYVKDPADLKLFEDQPLEVVTSSSTPSSGDQPERARVIGVRSKRNRRLTVGSEKTLPTVAGQMHVVAPASTHVRRCDVEQRPEVRLVEQVAPALPRTDGLLDSAGRITKIGAGHTDHAASPSAKEALPAGPLDAVEDCVGDHPSSDPGVVEATCPSGPSATAEEEVAFDERPAEAEVDHSPPTDDLPTDGAKRTGIEPIEVGVRHRVSDVVDGRFDDGTLDVCFSRAVEAGAE